jgi:hypothetical protein
VDGSAVSSHVDGVHDSQGATDAKAEAEEKSDDSGPVRTHDKWSLQPPSLYSSHHKIPTALFWLSVDPAKVASGLPLLSLLSVD